MARRVFVHVGTMKSATTYIQELFAANAESLAEQGLLCPPPDLPFLALSDLLGRDPDRPGRDGAWRRLVRSVRQHRGNALVSNELFAPLGPGRIRRLLRGLEPAAVDVVVTARDLGRVIPSHWQTTLKNGSTLTWADFSAAVCSDPTGAPDQADPEEPPGASSWFWRRHDIPAILSRWEPFVPADRMTVVTVPPPGSDPTLVGARFSEAIGIDADHFAQPEYENTSVGAHSAELLRRLNEVEPDLERHHYRWGIKDSLARSGLITRREREPTFALTPQQQDWVGARAERMIEEITASGVRVVGDLADLRPVPDARPGAVDPSTTSDTQLLEAALDGLGALVRIVADQQKELEGIRLSEPPG